MKRWKWINLTQNPRAISFHQTMLNFIQNHNEIKLKCAEQAFWLDLSLSFVCNSRLITWRRGKCLETRRLHQCPLEGGWCCAGGRQSWPAGRCRSSRSQRGWGRRCRDRGGPPGRGSDWSCRSPGVREAELLVWKKKKFSVFSFVFLIVTKLHVLSKEVLFLG